MKDNKGKLSFKKVRDIMTHVTLTKENNIVYNTRITDFYVPQQWKDDKPHNRIIRGAIKLTVANFQSALSNSYNGTINHFNFGPVSKSFNLLHFEDDCLPSYIKKIKREGPTKDSVDFTKGCTIKYDSRKKSYTLYYPEKVECKPRKKPFNKVDLNKDKISSVDEGIINAHTVYTHSNNGSYVKIHQTAQSEKIKRLLVRKDFLQSKLEDYKKRDEFLRKQRGVERHIDIANRKIKNCVQDMNKKLASELAKENDHILLPKFLVSELARKHNLQRKHKRLMYLWNLSSFRTFLEYKCQVEGTNLYSVTEEYTSKTCGNCGSIECLPHNGDRVHRCTKCPFKIDRDVNGARNITIKNLTPVE